MHWHGGGTGTAPPGPNSDSDAAARSSPIRVTESPSLYQLETTGRFKTKFRIPRKQGPRQSLHQMKLRTS